MYNLTERIQQLEDEIRGLTATVNGIYSQLKLEGTSVPRPPEVKAVTPAVKSVAILPPATQRLIEESQKIQSEYQQKVRKAREAAQPFLAQVIPSEPVADIAQLEPYEYVPLDPQDSQIRVLNFHLAKTPDDPIQCSLTTVSLDQLGEPEFGLDSIQIRYPVTTLSYVWGETLNTELIVVEGRSFRVTRNLYAALKHFRNMPEADAAVTYINGKKDNLKSFWWIDAICINQADLDERKSQVSNMTRLYRSTRTVKVWLGDEADDSKRAIELIRKLGFEPRTREEQDEWNFQRRPGQTHVQLGPGIPPRKLPDEPAPLSDDEKRDNYDVLVKLFSRPWFSRVWIRQEFALPESVEFHCGGDKCTEEELTKTASLLSFLVDELRIVGLERIDLRRTGLMTTCFRNGEDLRQLRKILRLKPGSKASPYSNVRRLVFQVRDADATDPRDKVYSILPLVNPDETGLEADYSRSYLETVKSMALDLAPNSLNFLCACQYSGERGDLPSWVPDLRRKWQYRPTIEHLHNEAEHRDTNLRDFRYSAPEFVYIDDQSAMKVKGVIYDTVSVVCEGVAPFQVLSSDLKSLRDKWRGFFVENQNGPRKEHEERVQWIFDWNNLLPQWPPSPGQSRSCRNFDMSAGPIFSETSGEMRTARRYLPIPPSFIAEEGEDEKLEMGFAPLWRGQAHDAFVGRKFVRTDGGAFGFVPPVAKVGDLICQFKGTMATFVIRRCGEDDTFILIGDARKSVLLLKMSEVLSLELLFSISAEKG